MKKTLAAAAFALAAAVANPAGGAGREAAPRFRLDILTADWQDLGRAQDWETAWPRLQEAAAGVFFSVDERDVATYDWPAQRIVLRPEAGARLLAAAQKLPERSERLYRLRALWSTDDLREIVNPRGFVVSLDGRPLYGGIFLDKHSNLSMEYPVLHSAVDEHRRVVLRFSPVQWPFGSLWDGGTGDALESAVHPAVTELREVFPDALERMPPERRKQIDRFRRLIRNPEVQALFAERGAPARPPAVAAVAKPLPGPPPLVTANPYSQRAGEGWSIYFGHPDDVAEVRYRMPGDPGDPGWHAAGLHGQAYLGRLAPGRHRVEVEALDWSGETVGRYALWLDPEREAIVQARHVLDMTANSWIGFSDRDEYTFLSYSHLLGRRDALEEARYSLDNCGLDRRVPLFPPEKKPGESEKGRLYEEVPAAVSYACVQLVYRDGETTAPRRFYHHPAETARDAPPPAPSTDGPGEPLAVNASLSSSGWSLSFQLEESARQVRYRLAGDPEWRSTGPGTVINLATGERLANTWIVLDTHRVTAGRHRIDVKVTNWDGVESGLYTVWFDPEHELVAGAKKMLREPGAEWARFDRDAGDNTLLYLSTVASAMDGLREVRYSVDGCSLEKRLPFQPWSYLGERTKNYDHSYLWLPRTVRSFCLQLVFRDGEVTEAREYVKEKAPQSEGGREPGGGCAGDVGFRVTASAQAARRDRAWLVPWAA
jgi:hypothetical protein